LFSFVVVVVVGVAGTWKNPKEEDGNRPPVHVVYSADDKMKPGVEASIRSIERRATQPIHFHYIGYTPMRSNPNVTFHNLTEIHERYRLEEFMNSFYDFTSKKNRALNTNSPNYARFALDKIFPNLEKVMYLDADTVFLCDIVPLFHYTFMHSPHALAATARKGFSGLTEKGQAYKHSKNITHSFNAGVLMFHLDRWREQKLSEKILNFTLENREASKMDMNSSYYRLGSQPPLALVIGEDFEDLGPMWNFQNATCLQEPGQCCLYHSKGSKKPWEKEDIPHFWQNLSEYIPPRAPNKTMKFLKDLQKNLQEDIEKNREEERKREKGREWEEKRREEREEDIKRREEDLKKRQKEWIEKEKREREERDKEKEWIAKERKEREREREREKERQRERMEELDVSFVVFVCVVVVVVAGGVYGLIQYRRKLAQN